MTQRIYLAGPMTGLPNLNFPAFHAEAARLRTLGYDVISPAELPHAANNLVFETPEEYFAHWQKCMRLDLLEMLTCDSVAMLDGWTASRGASLEHRVALDLGLNPRLASFFVERPVAGEGGAK